MVMEIIVRLRKERAALVARVNRIDEMLRQYEVWGREAQQLLSMEKHLTESAPTSATVQVNAEASLSASNASIVDDDIAQQVLEGEVGREAVPAQRKKTPMKEFEAAVMEVLRDARRPLDRVAVYEALTARNIVIGDGDRDKELNSLSARLYRMAQDSSNGIISERGQGYSLQTADEEADLASSDGAPYPDTNLDDLLR